MLDKECWQRGVREEDVVKAIDQGSKETAQRGLFQYKLNLEFNRIWAGRHYGVQQIVAIIADEGTRLVVVIVYAFYFGEGKER